MRVSAGFLVKGLSGKMRIQSLPPRLMKRVMATREASICRSVIQAGSSALSPYSPKDNSPPRHALPRRRPRCCLRYFTFFGINIKRPLNSHARRNSAGAALDAALGHVFALVDPALHANHAVGRVRLRESEIDVGAQCLQR